MDKKGVMSLAIIAFLVLGQSNSTRAVENPLCYAQCLTCLYGGPLAMAICSGFCAANCMTGSPSLRSVPKDNHYFCKLGCASSLCASFITRENPEIAKVGGCADSCSEKCTMMNTLPPNYNKD
ncbi:thionin-like protein 2 [Prunus yedoensis var. nudiflora]|uniref:Thionin-like protein 2 n=1 Tax=Prunus yedoensis var. nudiflora TaxID=2094558 RepID=A0A314XUY6_PRUYE|nr:thionin-like protein 2 [Prunus yedoensis var. nudiflora]